MNRLNSQHWTEYWKSGNATTFNNSFSKGYDEEIKIFWDRIFGQLKTNSKIVDFATGSGALLNLAANYSIVNQKNFELIGIDFSDIEIRVPERFNPDNFKVLANTSIEKTGLKDARSDLVVSQYGIEYANLSVALAEASRISCKNSKIALIVHSDDSEIVKESRINIQQVELCTKKLKILNTTKRLVLLLENKKRNELKNSDKKKADKYRNLINKDLVKLNNVINSEVQSTFVAYFLNGIMKVFDSSNRHKLSVKDKLEILATLEQEIADYQLRLLDLMSASLSESDGLELRTLLEEHGYKIQLFEPIFYQSSVVGTKVVAER